MGLPLSWPKRLLVCLAFAGALFPAFLVLDRIVAGVVQCGSMGSCPW